MIQKKNLKWLPLFVALVLPVIAVSLAFSRSIENFPDPDGPLFTGDYAPDQPIFDGELVVVTWNIKFGLEVEQAIEEWGDVQELARADIVLLQEMDETGVELVARRLCYNYIYYPASIHDHHGRTFGNAILSKWPIADPAKILLPNQSPTNEQRRIAVRAVVQIDEHEILAYSVHTETFVLSAQKRGQQIDALVDDINDQTQTQVVVGGDFNTLTENSLDDLVTRMTAAGLEWASAGTGPTVISPGGVGFTLDYLFAKGLNVLQSGVWPHTVASDHAPVWAVFSLE